MSTLEEIPLNSNNQYYKIKTPNRLKLFYVEKLPTSIELKNIKDILNEFDNDIINSLLEKDSKNLSQQFVYTQPYLNVKYLYIKNAYEITYAHLLVLLNKFPNAQIVLFISNSNSIKKLSNSVVDTHLNDLYVEDLRNNIKKRKLDKTEETITEINAKELLEQLKIEIQNRELWG